MIYTFTSFDWPYIRAILDGPDNVDMIKERKAWKEKNYVLKLPSKPQIVSPEIITSKTQAAMLEPIRLWEKECAALRLKLEADLAKEYGLETYDELNCFIVYLRRTKKYKDVPYKEGT